MKGLIIKDILTLKSYLKMLIIMMILLFGMGIVTQQIDSFLPILLVISPMVALVTFSYDQSSHWNSYGKTLPITNAQFVMSKYIGAIVFLIAGVTLITLLSLIIGKGFPNITLVLLSISYTFFILSFLFPTTYKFGPEKTRLMIIAFLMIPSILVTVLSEVNITISESMIETLMNLSPLISLILYGCSYFLSVSIFSKKEF